jgi:hypothetical protein
MATTLPVLFESCKVVANVIIFFGSGMPEIVDDGEGSLLAFVLVNGLNIFSGTWEVEPCWM